MSDEVSNSHTRNSRPVPPPEAPRFSKGIAGESSSQPRGKMGRFLRKVKNGVTKMNSRLKDSRINDPVLPNVHNKGALSTPNIEVQADQGKSPIFPTEDPQSALRDAKEVAKGMNTPWGPVGSVAASAAQNAQADLDTTDNIEATYLQPLRIFDTAIGKIAEVHPYAKIALGVLSCASKMVLAQVDRDQAVHSLLDKLGQVYGFMTQDETLGHISSMHTILGQISQQTLECARFIRDYSETKNFWKRLGKDVVSETDDTITQYSNVLDGLMQDFRDQVVRDVAIFVHRTGEILDLGGMTYAAGAGLDTRKQCIPGTRTEILSQITDWVNSTGDNVPRVLWLSGPAGTGKSAIAHTIANWFNDAGGLGSCYCFDRQRDADRRHEKIFSTIARDLADRDPEMRRALAGAVQNASSLKNTADIIQQWDKLIMKTLGKFPSTTVGPVVIVIDALDESGGVETRRDLLSILAGKLHNPNVPRITELPNNVRFIVTSRPLRDIDDKFTGVQHIQRMSMDEIPPEVAERDIQVYISKMLEGLLNFGNGEFAALAEKADGLFEWARLACGYINQTSAGLYPIERFDAVMSRNPGERDDLLYDMYRLILTEIMHTDPSSNVRNRQSLRMKALARFCSVMGQILGTAEPLPLTSLNTMRHHFPDERDRYDVEIVVKSMGPLLSGTTTPDSPIRPLHASFREFLTDPECSGDFFVDLSKIQRDLAFASLRVMEHGLFFNICDIKSSYLPNCEDPGLQGRVERCIPPHLSYCCRFWGAHVKKTDFDTELAKEVALFLDHERLLFWLEVLGLTNALSGAVAALPHIVQWLKGHDGYKDVSSMAIDVQRFIQVFGGIILHSTPHLYVSAMPFSPLNSTTSRKFAERFPNTLHLASGRDLDWTAAQAVLSGHTDIVMSVSFSRDGTRIVTGSADKTVRLWDTATGQPVREPLQGHTDRVNSVSFSPDGTRIVSGSSDKTIRLWDAATGQPVGKPLRGHTNWVNSVSFSPDGTRIVSVSLDQTVRLWDAATGQPVGQPFQGHTHWVNSVSFSPDGTRIVTGSSDKTIRLWDTATGQSIGNPLRGHTGSVSSVSFSPDGTRIMSSSSDQTVRLWDAVTGQPVGWPLRGHTDWVRSVSSSPDGTRIVTGSSDDTVRLWDTATGLPVGLPLLGHTDSVNSVSFSPDGTRIVTGSSDTTVRLWDAATGQPVGEPLWGAFHPVSLSPDGTRIVTGSHDNSVRLWEVATREPVCEPLRGHTGSVNSVSFSLDSTRIVSGSWDTTIRLWDAVTGQSVSEPFQGHRSSVTSVSFSPDGTRIVSGSLDKTVRLWDVATGQQVGKSLRGHTEHVNSVSFSPDGTCIVTGSDDGTVRLWDAATRQPVCEPLRGHTGPVFSVSFSPDGTRIVSGSHDSTARLWDTATRQPVGQPLQGHANAVTSVSVSPDGTRIVTGSSDKSIRLWDTVTGQPVGEPLLGHSDFVISVSFSRDGTRIVSGSLDGTVRVWFAAIGKSLQDSAEQDYPPFSSHGRRTTHPTENSSTITPNAANDYFIRFSSSARHALYNAAELMEGASHHDRRLTSFLLNRDGWMVGPNRRLLFWVPPASRQAFYYNPWTALVIPRGVELDLSRMTHGQHWRNCRAEPC